MDRHDALALLDVMWMQSVHRPPAIDEMKLIHAYLDVVPSRMPTLEAMEPACYSRISKAGRDDLFRSPELKHTKGKGAV